MKDLNRATTDEDKAAAQAAVDKDQEEIISAVKDFAKAYNSAVSFRTIVFQLCFFTVPLLALLFFLL